MVNISDTCKDNICAKPNEGSEISNLDTKPFSEWKFDTKKIVIVTSYDQWKELLNETKSSKGDKYLLVKFSAVWCGPCKKIAPFFNDLCIEYNKLKKHVCFARIDVDDHEGIMEECEIGILPTFQLYKDGIKVDSSFGGEENKLRDLLERNHVKKMET